MPETGYYEKRPRPESIKKLIEYLEGNAVVTKAEQIEDQVIRVDRNGKTALTVFLTNIYVVGDADVLEISAQNKGINAIVTMSAWNGYTNSAKELAKRQELGLFKFGEFLGAVYYNGQRFLDYTPPDPDKKRESRRS